MRGTDSIPIARRETVAEAAARALIHYIADHGLQGGDRLPSERQLSRMTGVSRLPLREALSILKGLGVVEAVQGKGVFVRPLDPAALFGMLSPLLRTQADIGLEHIFEVRHHLEPTLAELAAARRTPEDLAALADALAGMRAHYRDNKPAYIRHDMAFHQAVARSTANPVFHVLMASITDLLAEVHLMYPDDAARRKAALGEHEEMLQAVRDQDAAGARRAMLAHIRNARGRL